MLPQMKLLVSCLILAGFSARAEDKSWKLKISEPDEEGKFLSVPIYYGDWVPITRAKAAIDSVVAKLDGAQDNNHEPEPERAIVPAATTTTPQTPTLRPESASHEIDEILERIDETPQINYYLEKERQPFRQPVVGPQHHPYGHGHHGPQQRRPLRRQDHRANRRNHRKLPPPGVGQTGGSGLVNSISSFFGGGVSTQIPTTGRPQTTQGVFSLGQVFNIPNFLSPKNPPPNVPAPQRPGYISDEPAETILYHTPVIKTVEAPDLTKLGPPVIELGGGGHDQGEGEIVVGQRKPDDHLSGFYSVDFDDFSTGDGPRKPRKPVGDAPTLEKAPKKLSVLVSGLNGQLTDDIELAKLFKDGRMDGEKHKAFISKPDGQIPSGFNKVTLPFLDPSQADQYKESLPSVFIAPVGYKVPAGYKGHPLPYDPASIDQLNPTKVTVVHSTDSAPSANDVEDFNKSKNPFLNNRSKLPTRPSTTFRPVTEEAQSEEKVEFKPSLFDSARDPSRVVLDKLKLARNRPSLATFYNKTKTNSVSTVEEEVVDTEPSKKTRKRILTKVVRKPYNPDTTTPPAIDEVKTTVVRVVSLTPEELQVENQTKPIPAYTTIVPEQVRDEETTEYHTATTFEVRQEEVQVDVEATTFQPVQIIEEKVDKSDSYAEPSNNIQTFVATTIVPQTTTEVPSSPSPTSEPVGVYEPTPFSVEQRLDRLRLKNRKPAHKHFASFPAHDAEELLTSDEEPSSSSTSTETTSTQTTDRPYGLIRNRLNLRKYGFNTNNVNPTPTTNSNPFEANAAANVFGQRIRARKRPSVWNNGHEEEEQSSSTSEVSPLIPQAPKKSKADQYKKKFRPFFDQLYEQLTGNEHQQQDGQQDEQEQHEQQQHEEHQNVEEIDDSREDLPGRVWARRSTTTPNPFTINAEIYEVHPDSREIITTTKSTTTTTTTQAPTTTISSDNDYDSQPRVDDQPEEDIVYVDSPQPGLEYIEFKLPTTNGVEVSELVPVPPEGEVQAPEVPFEPSQPASDINANGLVHSEASLEYGESQREEDKWNIVVVPPPSNVPQVAVSEEKPVAPVTSDVFNPVTQEPQPGQNNQDYIPFQPIVIDDFGANRDPQVANSRLEEYAKNIQPLLTHLNDHHYEQSKAPIVNEHTQQHLFASEGDFIPFQPIDPEGPVRQYVEIQRVVAPSENEEDYIHQLVDQAYQLQDVKVQTENAAQGVVTTLKNVEVVEDEVTEETKVDDVTTQVVFVTRPTTIAPELEIHPTELNHDVEVKVTTVRSIEEFANDNYEIEPLPEFNSDQEKDDTPVSTTQDYVEVTTFRPKVTGGFFENFNIGNLLGFIAPATTTEQAVTTVLDDETTIQPEDVEETTITVEITDPVEVKGFEELPQANWREETPSSEQPVTPEADNAQVDSIVPDEPIVQEEPIIQDEPIAQEEPISQDESIVQDPVVFDEPIVPVETVQQVAEDHQEPIEEPAAQQVPGISDLLESDNVPEIVVTEVNIEDETTQRVIEDEVVPEIEHQDEDLEQSTVSVEVSTEKVESYDLPPLRFGRPKAISQPDQDEGYSQNEYDQPDIKQVNISKSIYGAIKREEFLKNWVASRKYHKFTEAGNKHGVIISPQTEEAVTEEDIIDDSTGTLQFVPTVLPNINKDDESDVVEHSGVVIKKKRKKVNSLLDKLSSSRKSLKDSLFAKSTTASTSTSSETTYSVQSSSAPEYPRGSDTKIFKQWQGDSLSQAEFERKVLGVSTATEVSVKSVICVRGRCYNADNVPSFVGH